MFCVSSDSYGRIAYRFCPVETRGVTAPLNYCSIQKKVKKKYEPQFPTENTIRILHRYRSKLCNI